MYVSFKQSLENSIGREIRLIDEAINWKFWKTDKTSSKSAQKAQAEANGFFGGWLSCLGLGSSKMAEARKQMIKDNREKIKRARENARKAAEDARIATMKARAAGRTAMVTSRLNKQAVDAKAAMNRAKAEDKRWQDMGKGSEIIPQDALKQLEDFCKGLDLSIAPEVRTQYEKMKDKITIMAYNQDGSPKSVDEILKYVKDNPDAPEVKELQKFANSDEVTAESIKALQDPNSTFSKRYHLSVQNDAAVEVANQQVKDCEGKDVVLSQTLSDIDNYSKAVETYKASVRDTAKKYALLGKPLPDSIREAAQQHGVDMENLPTTRLVDDGGNITDESKDNIINKLKEQLGEDYGTFIDDPKNDKYKKAWRDVCTEYGLSSISGKPEFIKSLDNTGASEEEKQQAAEVLKNAIKNDVTIPTDPEPPVLPESIKEAKDNCEGEFSIENLKNEIQAEKAQNDKQKKDAEKVIDEAENQKKLRASEFEAAQNHIASDNLNDMQVTVGGERKSFKDVVDKSDVNPGEELDDEGNIVVYKRDKNGEKVGDPIKKPADMNSPEGIEYKKQRDIAILNTPKSQSDNDIKKLGDIHVNLKSNTITAGDETIDPNDEKAVKKLANSMISGRNGSSCQEQRKVMIQKLQDEIQKRNEAEAEDKLDTYKCESDDPTVKHMIDNYDEYKDQIDTWSNDVPGINKAKTVDEIRDDDDTGEEGEIENDDVEEGDDITIDGENGEKQIIENPSKKWFRRPKADGKGKTKSYYPKGSKPRDGKTGITADEYKAKLQRYREAKAKQSSPKQEPSSNTEPNTKQESCYTSFKNYILEHLML